jgi:hypothetical protein
MKASRFLIRGHRAPLGATGEALDTEKPLLVHPYFDNPEEHLLFTEEGSYAGLTERGRISLEILGLNRDSLVDARCNAWREMSSFLSVLERSPSDALTDQVRRRLQPDQSYLAVQRQCVRRWTEDVHGTTGVRDIARTLLEAVGPTT